MQDLSRRRVGAAMANRHLRSKSGDAMSTVAAEIPVVLQDIHEDRSFHHQSANDTLVTATQLPPSSYTISTAPPLRSSTKRKASISSRDAAPAATPALPDSDIASPLLSRSTRRKINIDKVTAAKNNNKHAHSYSLDWQNTHTHAPSASLTASLPASATPSSFLAETPELSFKPMPQLSFSPSIIFSAVPPTPSSMLSAAIPSSHIGNFSPLQNHSLATSQSHAPSIPVFPASTGDPPRTSFEQWRTQNNENDPFSAALLTAPMYTTIDDTSPSLSASENVFRTSTNTLAASAPATVSLPMEYMFSPLRGENLTADHFAHPAFFDGMLPLKRSWPPSSSSSFSPQFHAEDQVFELDTSLPETVQPIFPSSGTTLPSELNSSIASDWHASNQRTPTKSTSSSKSNKKKKNKADERKYTREENLELFASQVRRGIESASLRDSIGRNVAQQQSDKNGNVGLGIFGTLPPLPAPLSLPPVFPDLDGSSSPTPQHVLMPEKDITSSSLCDGSEAERRLMTSLTPSATDATTKQTRQADATPPSIDGVSPPRAQGTIAGLPNLYHTPNETFTELAAGSAKYRTMPPIKPARVRPPRNHNKKRADGAPPRPPNAWILYRSSRWEDETFREACRGMPQKDVSKYIAELWRKEPRDVRDHYDQLADQRKREHEMRYPGYTYQPNRARTADRANLPTTLGDTYAMMQPQIKLQPPALMVRTNTAPARLAETQQPQSQLSKSRSRSRSAKGNKVRSSSARNANDSDGSESEYVQSDAEEEIVVRKTMSRSASRASPIKAVDRRATPAKKLSKSVFAPKTKSARASATPTPARIATLSPHIVSVPRYQQPTIASLAKMQSRNDTQLPTPAKFYSTQQPVATPQFSASVHAPTPTRPQFMHTQNGYQSVSQILADAAEFSPSSNAAMWTPYVSNADSYNWMTTPASEPAKLFTPNSGKRTLPAAPNATAGRGLLAASSPSLARSLSTQPPTADKRTQQRSPQMTRAHSSPAQGPAQIPNQPQSQDGMVIGGIFYPFAASQYLNANQEPYIVLQDPGQPSGLPLSHPANDFSYVLPDASHSWTDANVLPQATSRDLATSLSATSSLSYLPNTPAQTEQVYYIYEGDMNALQPNAASGLDPSSAFLQMQQAK